LLRFFREFDRQGGHGIYLRWVKWVRSIGALLW
jgi:hypothetical protein